MTKKYRKPISASFPSYQSYRPFLREEFDFTCVYCEVYESEMGGEQSFEIDHYAPQNQFPMLGNVYLNLFYSCGTCNRTKGGYWATREQRQAGRFVLNQYRHDFDVHIDKSEARWKPISDVGQWNIRRFYLDSLTLETIRKRRLVAKNVAPMRSLEQIISQVDLADDTQEMMAGFRNILSSCEALASKRLDSRRGKVSEPGKQE